MTADIKALTGSLNGGGASTASSSHTTPLPPKHDKMEADIKLSEEPSFDMLVLGCGGGPAENDLSAYWVKPAGQAWNDGFVSVDGGSCLGALIRLLASHPAAFRDFLDQPPTSGPSQQQEVQHTTAAAAAIGASTLLQAGQIYDMLQAFLVTHAHWDHISVRIIFPGIRFQSVNVKSADGDINPGLQGLVLSSSSGSSKQKAVYGSKQTISNLSSAMNGGLWPVLGSYEANKRVPYVWRDIEYGKTVKPVKGLSASIMPLSHGTHHQGSPYESSAFFLDNDITGKSILIFGDVEPDSVSGLTLNKDIWTQTAKRIEEGRLSALLVECSYCSSRPKDQLYGHLSPIYIAEELRVLASLIPPRPTQDATDIRGRLRGLTVCIVHVKDPTSLAEVLATSPVSPSEPIVAAPPSKRTRVSPTSSSSAPASARSTPSRRTRSTSSRTAFPEEPTAVPQVPKASMKSKDASTDVSLPEGIKLKIYNELQDLERRDQLGVKYLMLEQGMRLAF